MDLSNLEMTCLCDKENPKRFKYKDRLLHYELQTHKIMMKTMSQYPLTKKAHTYIHPLVHAYQHTNTCAHAHRHTRTYIRTHARTHARARAHTHTHTHTTKFN